MEREVDWEREAQNPPAPGRGGKRVARQGQSEPQSPGREMYQNVRTLVTVLAVLILVFTFVARIIVVSGPSRENTLQNGDAMLVWSLGYTPEQGDVALRTDGASLVLRADGRIELTGQLWINGQPFGGTVTG